MVAGVHDGSESDVYMKLFPGGSIWRNTSKITSKEWQAVLRIQMNLEILKL